MQSAQLQEHLDRAVQCTNLARLALKMQKLLVTYCPTHYLTGIKDGRFPKPVKLGPRITAWRIEDIRALIENGAA